MQKLLPVFNQNGLDARYISPKELGLLVTPEPGNARILPKALEKISAYRETQQILVIPGFFGYTEAGEICTFLVAVPISQGPLLPQVFKQICMKTLPMWTEFMSPILELLNSLKRFKN